MVRPLSFLLLAVLVALPARSPGQQQKAGRKVAFLVGVGTFQHDLADLNGAPQKDVAELEKVLRAGGFEVVKLTDLEVTKKAVEERFARLLDGGGDPAKALGRGDVLLVALCSHGFTFEVNGKQEPFVAGWDAVPGRAASMVSLNGLIATASPFGATKLFLVDACREVSDPNRSRGIEGTQMTLPNRTAVLFACGRGQLSHQNDALGHGLFTHAVLKVLKGETGLKDEVSWNELVAGVGRQFRGAEFKKFVPNGREQEPVAATGETGDVLLIRLTAGPATYTLTGENTRIEFTGTKPGGKNDGGFKTLSGTASVAGGTLTRIEVEIDTASLYADVDALTKHLKNPDFFNVKDYPTATFRTTRVAKTAGGYAVTGDLTLLGRTKSVTFPAEVTVVGSTLTVRSEFKINRHDWGMTYGKGKIDDDVMLRVTVRATR